MTRATTTRSVSGVVTMVVVWQLALATAGAAPGQPMTDAPDIDLHLRAEEAARRGMVLPNTMAASEDPKLLAVATALGGYDAAVRTGIARLVGDVHVSGPIDIRLGLTYLSDAPNFDRTEPQFQPQFGLRLRLLSQEREGIDLAAALLYRRERYTGDDGMVQALLAVGRRFGRFGLLANLAYGQDPEGDDRDGDVSMAVLYELAEPCQVALEGHLRFDIESDDPRRRTRAQGPFDLQAGPVIHYGIGPLILTAQAGVSAFRFEHTRTGVFAVGGLAGAY